MRIDAGESAVCGTPEKAAECHNCKSYLKEKTSFDGILLMMQWLTEEARGQVHHQSAEGREQRGGNAHE